MWSHSSQELFYQSSNPRKLMSVQVQPTKPTSSFFSSPPAPLFDLPMRYRLGPPGRAFDVSLDDKRFLMVRAPEGENQDRLSLIIVTHWFDDLTARVKRQ